MIPLLRHWLDDAFARAQPILVALTGSNGAGKSTYYRKVLKDTRLPFVNADDIAKALRPNDPGSLAYDAMHLAEAMRQDLLAQRQSFVMETVFSDAQGAKLGFLRAAREAGYTVVLIAIRLESVELSSARVLQRVLEGGHDVPDEKLRERFPRTQANIAQALPLVDLALVFDNSDLTHPYRLVEHWQNGQQRPLPNTPP